MSKHTLAMSPKPLVLLAGLEARQTAELSSALIQGGFRVVTAESEHEAAEAAQQDDQPHAILLDAGLAAPDYRVCLKLHALALATPILLICPAALTRSEQLARRASELAALATRHGLTLACAVFQPAQPSPTGADDDRMAAALRSAGRTSDAVGRSGQTEFAVFAPATSTLAAARIMRRLTASIEHALGFVARHSARVGVRSGYSASHSTQHISPPGLLARARSVLETQ